MEKYRFPVEKASSILRELEAGVKASVLLANKRGTRGHDPLLAPSLSVRLVLQEALQNRS